MAFFSTEHQHFYDLIGDYYNNPVMYKIKNDTTKSMYGIQLPSRFLNQRFYVICITPPLAENELPLKELPWESLQVRTSTSDNYSHLPVYEHRVKDNKRFEIPLEIVSRNREISVYRTKNDSILKVSLLHSKGLEYEYNDKGTLKSALETKQTILQFNKSL